MVGFSWMNFFMLPPSMRVRCGSLAALLGNSSLMSAFGGKADSSLNRNQLKSGAANGQKETFTNLCSALSVFAGCAYWGARLFLGLAIDLVLTQRFEDRASELFPRLRDSWFSLLLPARVGLEFLRPQASREVARELGQFDLRV